MAATRHVQETYVRATPEQVWEAITSPEFTRQYFHGTAWARPLAEGEPFVGERSAGTPAVDGTVEVLDAPRRLVLTWRPLYDAALAEEPPGRVEWIVEPVGEGVTRLRVEHSDLAQSPLTWAATEHDWPWVLDGLKSLLETGEALPPVRLPAPAADPEGEWHRLQAVTANNSVWELLELPARTRAQDEDMLQRAYAARYHWARAARRGPANVSRGAWLLARVQLRLGRPDLALQYAEETLAVCREHGLVDFDLAYAHEARARALAALGRTEEAAAELEAARAVPVADAEDRAALERDLADRPAG